MNILHVTPHLGGGVGTVVLGWVKKDMANNHTISYLEPGIDHPGIGIPIVPCREEEGYDIIVVHYWERYSMRKWLSIPHPASRLVFWSHRNDPYPQSLIDYPDRWIDVSPVQGYGDWIWSTGGVERFLDIQPKDHAGFNIGTVASPKLHENWFEMCEKIKSRIPEATFTVLGVLPAGILDKGVGRLEYYNYVGRVSDVAPYMAEMDVFGYPLRRNHFGTCEQVIGEAMATGVVPVVGNNLAEMSIIDHTYNGLVANTKKDYIDSVVRLYEDPKFRKNLSRMAKEDARYFYCIHTMIRKWNGIFRQMMKQPKRERGTI
jgi:glycosyltransferase involved in cell wall biosynthesis